MLTCTFSVKYNSKKSSLAGKMDVNLRVAQSTWEDMQH
jgi:hypothetical protein